MAALTERAQRVLLLAEVEARLLNHAYIGTEHLILGLLREGEGLAIVVLTNLGVELEKVRSTIEIIIGRGDSSSPSKLKLSLRASRVIELAVDEARSLNHAYIGTEHLLLGLAREDEGIAAVVLGGLGVTVNSVRQEVKRILRSRVTPRQQLEGVVQSLWGLLDDYLDLQTAFENLELGTEDVASLGAAQVQMVQDLHKRICDLRSKASGILSDQTAGILFPLTPKEYLVNKLAAVLDPQEATD